MKLNEWIRIILSIYSLLDLIQRMKNGFAWFRVSIKQWRLCWNCAITVIGCFLAFPICPWACVLIPVLPAKVFTVCRFLSPFFPLSLGLKDLFFLLTKIIKNYEKIWTQTHMPHNELHQSIYRKVRIRKSLINI